MKHIILNTQRAIIIKKLNSQLVRNRARGLGLQENFGDKESNNFIDFMNEHDVSWKDRDAQLTKLDIEIEALLDKHIPD